MTLVKTKPKVNQVPSVFTDFFDTDRFFAPRWFGREFAETLPAANIKEAAKQFTIELAAPGFNKNDINISVEEDVITISAEKKEGKNDENERFTRHEYSYKSFSRSFTLPPNANAEKVDATYENGILKLVLPKKAGATSSARKQIIVS